MNLLIRLSARRLLRGLRRAVSTSPPFFPFDPLFKEKQEVTNRFDMMPIEQATDSLKSTVGINAGKVEGEAKEVTGEVKGKAAELSGEAKGKGQEVAGQAKGKAEEIKGKL